MKTSRPWIEAACHIGPDPAGEEAGVIVRSLSTEHYFLALLAHGEGWSAPATRVPLLAAWEALSSGADLALTAERLLAALPARVHLPWTVLQVGPAMVAGQRPAQLLECDAPPAFYARRGEVVLLPVVEEEAHGRLLRRCEFDVQAGDHLALVSESAIRAFGGPRTWNWRTIAVSIRRLTVTGGSAEELAAALARLAGNSKLEARSWKPGAGSGKLEAGTVQDVTPSPAARSPQPVTSIQLPASILALRVRPMRSLTVWTGPPAERRRDREALARLMAEEGARVICGDTTAAIAARLLGGRLELAPPPPEGWGEVPPTLRLTGAAERVDLLTEGAVTLRVAAGRLAEAQRPRDLAGREDGASRLAQLLLEADKVTLLVGQAVNPAQTERDGTPLRRAAIERLVEALRARGKIVETAFF